MPTTIPTTTSTARASLSPDPGDAYFETDTKNYIIYDGANWRVYNYDSTAGWTASSYSLDFDGTDDYMKTIGFTLGSAYSFSVWFNLDTSPTNATLLNSEHYFTSGYDNFVYRITDSTTINLFSYSGTSAVQPISITVPSLSTGTWYNLVLTNTGSGSAQGYLDGSTVTTTGSTSRPFTDLQNSKGLIVGDNLTNNNNPFNGKIDEVAVFNYSLSSSDVTSIYNSGTAGNLNNLTTGPLGWWRMGENDEGTGTTVTDQGSGGNNGTLVNGPIFSTSVPS